MDNRMRQNILDDMMVAHHDNQANRHKSVDCEPNDIDCSDRMAMECMGFRRVPVVKELFRHEHNQYLDYRSNQMDSDTLECDLLHCK